MIEDPVGSSTRSGATATSGRKSSSLGLHEPPGCEGLPTYPVAQLDDEKAKLIISFF